MNSTKPLSYECLKSVISQCEANLRFILADRIPAIRNLEKLVALKVHFLHFHSFGFKVNKTDYFFAIVKRHPKTQEKDEILETFCHDLDEFGCPDHSASRFVNPGDVVRLPIIEYDDDFNDEQWVKEDLEDALKWKREIEKRSQGRDLIDLIDLQLVNDEIEHYRNLIACYHNRRHNIHPNYEMFIQLTITMSNGKQNVQLMKYDVSMFESMRNLSTQFFGGRNCAVNVKIFDISNFPDILRVPEGLKLKIEHLHTSSPVFQDVTCIRPLLDESCLLILK